MGGEPGGQFLSQKCLPPVGPGAVLALGGSVPVGVEAGLATDRHDDRQPRVVVPLEGGGVDVPTVEVVLSTLAVEEVDRMWAAVLKLDPDVAAHRRGWDIEVLHRQPCP